MNYSISFDRNECTFILLDYFLTKFGGQMTGLQGFPVVELVVVEVVVVVVVVVIVEVVVVVVSSARFVIILAVVSVGSVMNPAMLDNHSISDK